MRLDYVSFAGVAAGLLLAGTPAAAIAQGASGAVTLVAEPLASTPLLYPGKALIPLGGSVRMVAIADFTSAAGKHLDPSTLTYTWAIDDVGALSTSGVGRRVAIVDSPLEYRSETVTVTVASPDGGTSSSASLDIAAAEPTLRLYERDPLMGIRFERALEGTYALAGSEATLYAAPYSFPTALGAPLLSWTVAGALAQTGSLVTLRPTGAGQGSAAVSATAESRGSVDAPAASEALTVTFGSAGGTGIFGL